MQESPSRNNNAFTVCIIQPNKSAYSETFIRAHVDRLPAKVNVLYGDWYPSSLENGTPLLSPDLISVAVRALLGRLLHISAKNLHTKSLVRFLQRNQVDVVLAEYGPTGVSVMEACRQANVPLVVHFHGFVVYNRQTLEEFGPDYQRMLSVAHAVIAVSRDMERDLLSLGVPPDKLHHNPSGVDTILFAGAEPAEAQHTLVADGRFVDNVLLIESNSKVCEHVQESVTHCIRH